MITRAPGVGAYSLSNVLSASAAEAVLTIARSPWLSVVMTDAGGDVVYDVLGRDTYAIQVVGYSLLSMSVEGTLSTVEDTSFVSIGSAITTDGITVLTGHFALIKFHVASGTPGTVTLLTLRAT